ncbi:MAG: hypothetical protein HY779_03340 [Rubrobacteridae bacterium]|nr:hypothetical protein [Rubrobacteridae bacterium]
MELLKRQSFTRLILISVALVVIPFAMIIYTTYNQLGILAETKANMNSDQALFEKVSELEIAANANMAALYKLTGYKEQEDLQAFDEEMATADKLIVEIETLAAGETNDATTKGILETLLVRWADYDEISELVRKRYQDERYVKGSFEKIDSADMALDDAMKNAFADIKKDLGENSIAMDKSFADIRKNIMNGVVIDAIMLALALLMLRLSVLNRLKRTFSEFNNASQRLSNASHELAANANVMNQTTEQITSAIGQVAIGAADQSRSAADAVGLVEQIAGAIDQVAQSAQTQVASVDEMATGINQLVDSISRVSENANTVTSVVEEASAVASKGKTAVDDTIAGMERIKYAVSESAYKIQTLGDTSKQIGEIVEVIDDIAEQTNLLALNAAIEAARAGEHGKGFAVVADEVRKLAERSARATGEIADLIRSIQDETMEAVDTMEKGTSEVESGSKLAENAGEAIEEMMSSIREVVTQIAQVSENADGMAAASNQVSRAVEQIAAISEENSATAEEVSSSTSQVVNAVDTIAASSQESAASAQEVSATTEEQSASIQEVSAQVQSLASMSEELDKAISSIKI